jgi:hypothetical protein
MSAMDNTKTASGVRFVDALDELKALGFNEAALLVVDDSMMKMIAAWPMVVRTYLVEPESGVDPGIPEIWGSVSFVMQNWAALANIPEWVAWELWKTIIAHGFIYPDGTIPDKVERFLISRVNAITGDADG